MQKKKDVLLHLFMHNFVCRVNQNFFFSLLASDMCEITRKSQTCELLKKTEPKKDRQPSLGSLGTLNQDLNSEITIRSKKAQQKQSSEISK